jgi:hypothetical protein
MKALCHILVTIIVAQLISRVTAAPTTFAISNLASVEPCKQIGCSTGHAKLDPETEACICPGSPDFSVSHRSIYFRLHEEN